MSPSCTIDGVTTEVDEVDLEVTAEGIEIFGLIDSINGNLQNLVDYLGSKDNSENTIRSVRIQDGQNIRGETCNGIFDGIDYDYQKDGTIRFRITIRDVPELSGSQ